MAWQIEARLRTSRYGIAKLKLLTRNPPGFSRAACAASHHVACVRSTKLGNQTASLIYDQFCRFLLLCQRR